MITQRYKPQNEILGFSASKRSNKILLSGPQLPAVLSFPLPLSRFISESLLSLLIFLRSLVPCPLLVQRFAVIPPDPGTRRLTILKQPSQNKCKVSRPCFNKGGLCAMSRIRTSSSFSKAVFESPCCYPSLLHSNVFLFSMFSPFLKLIHLAGGLNGEYQGVLSALYLHLFS